jgi:hypothetical protein
VELVKNGIGASGSTAGGIPLANLSSLTAGANAGPLMLQVITNNPMHFVTGNVQRMQIDGGGDVTINSLAPGGIVTADATGKLGITSGTALGTGSPNYFPKWNSMGTGLTATSTIYEVGGKVGFNTTSPNYDLTFGNMASIGIATPTFPSSGADLTIRGGDAFGSNQSSGRLFISGGASTGNGGGTGMSTIHFMTSPGSISGSAMNSMVQVANFTDDGRLTVSRNFGSTSVAHLWTETDSEQRALYAQNRSTGGTSYGSYSEATGAATNNYGAFGSASGSVGAGINVGVYGTAVAGSSPAIGVQGNSSGSGSHWSGYFTGGSVYVENRLGVGLAALNPAHKLHVMETIAGAHAIHSENTSTAANDGTGVFGRSVNNPGYGYGVFGQGGYIGSYGEAQATTYTVGYGVYGSASGTTGTRYGVYGTALGGATNYGVYCNGSGGYTGTWTLISDARFKENVEPLSNALEQVLKLEPKTYTMKREEYGYMNFPEGRQFGLIAQEVEKVFPELVESSSNPGKPDANGRPVQGAEINYKAMNYIGLTPILVQAIKDQQKIIEQMQKQLDEQKEIINQLIKK